MDYITPFTKEINNIFGVLIALPAMIFGKNWFLFAFFLGLNLCDFITGWIKFTQTKTENSTKGLKGVIKKFGYWVMIALSFGMSAFFIEIGRVLGVNLQITELLGFFVLGSLIINEIRSNLENLVEAGYNLPPILIKSLEVANKVVHEHDGSLELHLESDVDKPDRYHINLDIPLEDLERKDEIRLKINKKEE